MNQSAKQLEIVQLAQKLGFDEAIKLLRVALETKLLTTVPSKTTRRLIVPSSMSTRHSAFGPDQFGNF